MPPRGPLVPHAQAAICSCSRARRTRRAQSARSFRSHAPARSTATSRACWPSARDTRRLNAEQQTLNRLRPIKSNAMSRRHVVALGALALACAFVAVGFVGVDRYARNYWLYRGFPPPHDPAYVTQAGTQEHIQGASAALPGRPLAFMLTVRMGVVEDELVAKNLAQPVILVMPFGSTGTFTDKEWANGG